MVTLTNKEVQIVKEDLKKKGITMPGLDNDLVDHLLCSIEARMASGHSFSESYRLASRDLNGDQAVSEIQHQTVAMLNERTNLLRNVLIYFLIFIFLIGVSTFLTPRVNPAIILTCITLSILFTYHSVFQGRKNNTYKSNIILFVIITAVPVTGILFFLATEFGFQLHGSTGWIFLIISLAVPVYLKAVKDFLAMDRTVITLVCYTLKFTAVICLLWVPLVLSLRMFRPDVSISFFLADFLVLSIVSCILCIGFRKFEALTLHIRNNF